jgi:tetratricopeptide (TPR) repeat protein
MSAQMPRRHIARARWSGPPRALGPLLWALLAACVGCVEQVDPEAKKLLTASKAAYDCGDDEAVIRDTTAFLKDHAKSQPAEVAYYLRGLALYRRGNLPAARADLKLAASHAQRKDVRTGALKALGDLAFDSGDADWAEGLYREALAEMEPKAAPADEVRYRLGCALQRKGRWGEADEQFDRVVHVFAGTQAARRAERRLRCVAWTVQAGAFARRDAARAEAARLRARGLTVVTRPETVDAKLCFLVQVGLYDTYEQAAAALPAVRALRSDAFVTPTRYAGSQ